MSICDALLPPQKQAPASTRPSIEGAKVAVSSPATQSSNTNPIPNPNPIRRRLDSSTTNSTTTIITTTTTIVLIRTIKCTGTLTLRTVKAVRFLHPTSSRPAVATALGSFKLLYIHLLFIHLSFIIYTKRYSSNNVFDLALCLHVLLRFSARFPL